MGGIVFAHPTGPAGHSDGDAVIHALCDALMGAAGLDDLGSLFPDTDPRHLGQDSAEFLVAVVAAIAQRGFGVVNVDLVIATEGPRIAPERERMRKRLADLLGIDSTRVNVKGKTLEGMGALAHGAGIAVQAVCLLAPRT